MTTTPTWCKCGCNVATPCSCAVDCGHTPEVGPYGLRVGDRVHVTPADRWGQITGFHGPQVRVLLDARIIDPSIAPGRPGRRADRTPDDHQIFDAAELVLASGQ